MNSIPANIIPRIFSLLIFMLFVLLCVSALTANGSVDLGVSPSNTNGGFASSIILGVVIIIVGVPFGILPLYKGLRVLTDVQIESTGQTAEEKEKIFKNAIIKGAILATFGAVIVISCLSLLSYILNLYMNQGIILAGAQNNTATASLGGIFAVIVPVLLGLLIFGAVLLMCFLHKVIKDTEPGAMRKTIAGILVIGLVAVILFALTAGSIENKDIVTQYIQLVGVIIAFYFGSRVAGDAAEKLPKAMGSDPSVAGKGSEDGVVIGPESHKESEDVTIEKVTINTTDKKMRIKLSNRWGKSLNIIKVILEDEAKKQIFERGVVIPLKSTQKDMEIPVEIGPEIDDAAKFDYGKKYNIVVATDSTPVTCLCQIEKIEP